MMARHDAGVRFRAPTLVLPVLPVLALVLALTGALSSCSDDPEPATGPGLPSQKALQSYFEAIASGDADQTEQARKEVAAKGSPAAGYAAYVGATDEANANAGGAADPVDVEAVDRGFRACVADDQCIAWTNLKGQDGRLVDFTVGGVLLTDSLVDLTAQAPIAAPGLYRVQPEWAYRVPNGILNVVVTATALDVPLSPKPATYIAGDQIIKGVKDVYPDTVDAGSSSPVVLSFEDTNDVTLDGQITFALKLGDAGSESIGFGLADPPGS